MIMNGKKAELKAIRKKRKKKELKVFYYVLKLDG